MYKIKIDGGWEKFYFQTFANIQVKPQSLLSHPQQSIPLSQFKALR